MNNPRIIRDHLIGEFDYDPALDEVPHDVLWCSEPARLTVTKTQLQVPPPLSDHTSIIFCSSTR